MDVSKYRTRFPPKEHEEAVRMLLEGLDKPQAAQTSAEQHSSTQRNAKMPMQQRLNRSQHDLKQQQVVASRTANHPREVSPTSSIDSGSLAQCDEDDEQQDEDAAFASKHAKAFDERHEQDHEFNSEESSSLDQIQVSPQISSKHAHRQQQRDPSEQRQDFINKQFRYNTTNKQQQVDASNTLRMHSKATSTASESTSGDSRLNFGTFRRPSVARSSEGGDLTIPSRTIAVQCDLKVSSVANSKRGGACQVTDSASSDLASMQASSISSTRYGCYKLTADTLAQRRLLARSISSRNIAHATSDEEQLPAARRLTSTNDDEASDLSCSSSSQLDVVGDNHDNQAEPTRRQAATIDRWATTRGDQRAASRKQLDDESLPLRPRTAMSYVSSSRLRDDRDDNDEWDFEEERDERRDIAAGRLTSRTGDRAQRQPLLRNRAVSHQALSWAEERPGLDGGQRASKRRQPTGLASSSNSDSELGSGGTREKLCVPRHEELLVTRRGQQVQPGGHTAAGNLAALNSSPAPDYPPSAARTRPYVPKKSGGQLIKRSQTLTNGLNTSELPNFARARAPSNNNVNESINQHHRRHRPPTSADDTADELAAAGQPAARRLLRHSSMLLERAPARTCGNSIAGSRAHPQARAHINDANEQLSPPRYAHAEPTISQNRHHHHEYRTQHATSNGHVARNASMRPTARLMDEDDTRRSGQQLGRSISMKQVNSLGGSSNPLAPTFEQNRTHQRPMAASDGRRHVATSRQQPTSGDSSCCDERLGARDDLERADRVELAQFVAKRRTRAVSMKNSNKRSESDDSESPGTRTWANPSLARNSGAATLTQRAVRAPLDSGNVGSNQRPATMGRPQVTRAAARSHSMRDVAMHQDVEEEEQDDDEYQFNAARGENQLERIYRAADQPRDEFRSEEFCERSVHDYATESEDEEAQSENSLCNRAAAHSDLLTRHPPQLDFDSQQRLNEIGLPACDQDSLQPPPPTPHVGTTSSRRPTAHRLAMSAAASSSSSASHLGLGPNAPGPATRYATTGRRKAAPTNTYGGGGLYYGGQQQQPGAAITGRAMSQQSLTRPTMPLSRRLRRSGNATSGSQSGASEAGGSSMSLVSRMRYENAHTRSPVVMYIPQALPKASSSDQIRRMGASSAASTSASLLLRKSSSRGLAGRRLHQSPSTAAHERHSQRFTTTSSSRQASDSEASSSSMLRTLVKPRNSRAGGGGNLGRAPSGRRTAAGGRLTSGNAMIRRNGPAERSDEEEKMDGVGQLASEMDSYKFRRRYSVPKDAKINWFSKLKQRVTSGKH